IAEDEHRVRRVHVRRRDREDSVEAVPDRHQAEHHRCERHPAGPFGRVVVWHRIRALELVVLCSSHLFAPLLSISVNEARGWPGSAVNWSPEKERSVAELIAIGYPYETTAIQAEEEAQRLAKDLIIQPDAIAAIVRTKDGKFKVTTNHHVVGAGASYGMLWG